MATQYDPTIFGYQNFYSALLTADITSGSLTISVDTVPSATSGILVIDPDSATNREVIFYTSKGASNIVCPSDGRGWAGSTATSHLTGTTVIMADVAQYFTGLANGTLSTDPIRNILITNFVQSGGVIAISAGLVGTFSNITFYLNGQQYVGTSIANKTYTASKDTYVDVTAASGGAVTVLYTEVANGAASPALTTNYLRVGLVVTNGSAITTIQQSGYDTLGNRFSLVSPINPKQTLMWYEEIGRITATATTTSLSVNIPNRKYIKIISNIQAAGAVASLGIRFNADATAANYAYRVSDNGGADTTGTFAGIPLDTGGATDVTQTYSEVEVLNISGQEKIAFGHSVNGGVNTGSGNPPKRRETQGKYTQTGSITSIQVVATTNIIASGSEIIILAHD